MNVDVPTTTGRVYPLRDAMFSSYEAIGIEALPGLDANAGDNLGFGEIAENRRNGKRQITPEHYTLNRIIVLTESLVERILLEDEAMNYIRKQQLRWQQSGRYWNSSDERNEV